MGKRLHNAGSSAGEMPPEKRRTKTICSCSSPRPSFLSARTFSWFSPFLSMQNGFRLQAFCSRSICPLHSNAIVFDEDIWTEIAKFLDGKSLIMLAATNRWFRHAIMDDGIWKFVCLRDLQVPSPQRVAFKWSKLYTSAFDGSHSYMFRQQDKHIDWKRIGAFYFDSSVALLTERLTFPENVRKEETIKKMLRSHGCCFLDNVKSGIWIADLQLVQCPVCDNNTCDGTMQTLDARHIELFLNEGYQNGSWEYQLVGSHNIKKRADGAAGAIFDTKHLQDSSTSAVFDYKSWIGKHNDRQPKAMIAFHGVAVNTNLQENEGLNVKYHAMRAGPNGEVVSIRISQQLL